MYVLLVWSCVILCLQDGLLHCCFTLRVPPPVNELTKVKKWCKDIIRQQSIHNVNIYIYTCTYKGWLQNYVALCSANPNRLNIPKRMHHGICCPVHVKQLFSTVM